MSKLDFEIRPVIQADLPTLQRVREKAFAPVFRSFRSIAGEELARIAYAEAELEQGAHLDKMCQPNSRHHVYVAATSDLVIGFCGYTTDCDRRVGQIGLNAVDPDYAARGVGTALYEFVLARMKDEGMKAAGVGTGGDQSHAPARRAYEKAGFLTGIPSVLLYRRL